MNEKFFDLSEEKRNAIINAGFSVFSQSEYRHATTDEIVKRAGISKGLLFHYFGNKKNFYVYLYDYAIAFLVEHTSELYDYKETDFFDSFA
ncbi:MAG: TetR/AcrR family transcriptional regulator, partial [Raoultibacter sp.]